MKPGDWLEAAVWLNGTETPELIVQFKRDIEFSFAQSANNYNVILRPEMEVEMLSPGDDRVPQVPPHISGPDVKLLVCSNVVVERKPELIVGHTGFVDDLEHKDLVLLRRITRMSYRKSHPGMALNNKQCDVIINHLGPDAALRTLGRAPH